MCDLDMGSHWLVKLTRAAAATPCPAAPAAGLSFAHLKLCSPVQAFLTGSLHRCLAASASRRSEEEKKSRKAAREEETAAHKQFPFLPTKSTNQVYVLDRGLAGEIAEAVVKNQTDPTTSILETNPGPGVLTEALLKAGANRIVLAESQKGFLPYVQDAHKQYRPQVMAAFHLDYLSAWRRLGDADGTTTAQFEASMSTLCPPRPWREGPPVSVVAMVPEQKERPFLSHLILACGRQQNLYSLGRPEWFLALSSSVYKKLLVAQMETRPVVFYNHLAIVLHLLFDIRLCAQLPGWKFTPHFPEKRTVLAKRGGPQVSRSMRYLVRLRPHVDQQLTLTEIPSFYSFLVQVMRRKKLRLIPKMEQLVPGCGINLIKSDVTMMSLVADISPHHFVAIFKAMQSWPEYQGSPLKQLLANTAFPTAEEDSPDDSHKDGAKSSGKKVTSAPLQTAQKGRL